MHRRRLCRLLKRETVSRADNSFLTVTEAGILSESEGLSLYYPWSTYTRADMTEGVLVLFLPNGMLHYHNLQTTPAERRTELLHFTREWVGKVSDTCIAPPAPIRREHVVSEVTEYSQSKEIGDIITTSIEQDDDELPVVAIIALVLIVLAAGVTVFLFLQKKNSASN